MMDVDSPIDTQSACEEFQLIDNTKVALTLQLMLILALNLDTNQYLSNVKMRRPNVESLVEHNHPNNT